MPDFLTAPVQAYLDRLASGDSTPGGGSAAALTGAMGAALLCMSARFTVGREKLAAFEAVAQTAITEGETLRAELQTLVELDAEAFAQYGAAMALPRSTDEEKAVRAAAMQTATRAAAAVPLAIARASVGTLRQAAALAEACNPYLVSDVAVAAYLAFAALRSAEVNVRINLASLKDADAVAAMNAELAALLASARVDVQGALASAWREMHLTPEGDLLA